MCVFRTKGAKLTAGLPQLTAASSSGKGDQPCRAGRGGFLIIVDKATQGEKLLWAVWGVTSPPLAAQERAVSSLERFGNRREWT